MSKIVDIKELEERIEILESQNKKSMEQINEWQTKMHDSNDSFTRKNYKRMIDSELKDTQKNSKEIDKLKYQISVGGRKLKSTIAVSKDLVNQGFTKAKYTASSMVRGWGNWTGQFSVEEESGSTLRIWWRSKNTGENYDNFVKYLKEKYSTDLNIDSNNNIFLMK